MPPDQHKRGNERVIHFSVHSPWFSVFSVVKKPCGGQCIGAPGKVVGVGKPLGAMVGISPDAGAPAVVSGFLGGVG
jgi:hypothetical protein